MKHAIQHGRKNAKPDKSKSPAVQAAQAGQQEAQPSFMNAPGVPDIDAPGQMLGHDQVPGAGFAPH